MKLDGKEFRQITESTLEHDGHTVAMLRTMGFGESKIGETEVQMKDRVLAAVVSSGYMLPLLGHLLIPAEIKDLDWTPEIAQETAKYLAGVHSPEAKSFVTTQIVQMAVFFCQAAVASLLISQKSSGPVTLIPNHLRSVMKESLKQMNLVDGPLYSAL